MAFIANDLVSEQRNSKACGRIKARPLTNPSGRRTDHYVSQRLCWARSVKPQEARARARLQIGLFRACSLWVVVVIWDGRPLRRVVSTAAAAEMKRIAAQKPPRREDQSWAAREREHRVWEAQSEKVRSAPQTKPQKARELEEKILLSSLRAKRICQTFGRAEFCDCCHRILATSWKKPA